VTPTRTPTPTPTPGLLAQLATDRGCLDTGQNAAYTVGEQANVFFEVDGVASGGTPITQVHVQIADYSNGHLVDVADFGSQPTGVTLEVPPPYYPVQPPTGTETLVLLADAAPIPLTVQTQCSFTVVSAGCVSNCDCPAGESCDNGSCFMSGSAFCCTSGNCPVGAACQNPNGSTGVCPSP
jgi:hypothetical protein